METAELRRRQAELVARLSEQLSPQQLAELSKELEEVARLLEKRR